MRMMNQAGIDLLKRWETGPEGGFAASPYPDPAGHPTIGWGHKLVGADAFQYPISEQQAEGLLVSDVARFETAVDSMVTAVVSPNQFAALVSLAYNIGDGAFQRSTLLRLLNAEAPIEEIIHQFHRWVKAGGQRLRGLELRRADEAALFLSA